MNLTRRSFFISVAGASAAVVAPEIAKAMVAAPENVLSAIEHHTPEFQYITADDIERETLAYLPKYATVRDTGRGPAMLRAMTDMRRKANAAGKVLVLQVSDCHPWGRSIFADVKFNIPHHVTAQCYEVYVSHDRQGLHYLTMVKSKRAPNVVGKRIGMVDYMQLERYAERLRDGKTG